MNVLKHEFRARLRSTLIWAGSMIVFMLLCMAKFDTLSANGGEAIQALLKSFPSSVQAMYGMTGLDLTTVAGYYGVCFLFVAIIAAVHAGLLGSGLIAREELTHTTEFLYVKPMSRVRVVAAKFLVGCVNLGSIWGAIVIGSIIAIATFAHMDGFWHPFFYLMIALLLIQLTFMTFGMAMAAFLRRSQDAAKVTAGAIFVSYLLYVVAKLSSEANWLHYGSIFSYFDAADILNYRGLKLHYIVACLATMVFFTALTFVVYRRRDLRE